MRASAAQKATTHGEKTKVGAVPEAAAAAAGQVEGEEDVKILGRRTRRPGELVEWDVQDRMEKADGGGSEKS